MWGRRLEGFAPASDGMQAFTTTIDMLVGDSFVTSRFSLDQGFSEASERRARIAFTWLTEINREPRGVTQSV